MVGTSISNEVDGIRAPTMWPTHLIQHRMAANWSFFERITLRATVRCKLIAYDAEPRHTFWVGRTSYGESRLVSILNIMLEDMGNARCEDIVQTPLYAPHTPNA
jgi:hypothetical protein